MQEHGIHAGNEGLAGGVAPRKVPADHVIGNWQEPTVRTRRALDAWLFADAPHPLVGARWCISRFAGFPALEPTRVHVFIPRKSERNNAIFSPDEENRWTRHQPRSTEFEEDFLAGLESCDAQVQNSPVQHLHAMLRQDRGKRASQPFQLLKGCLA
jgi:hypothetical protein